MRVLVTETMPKEMDRFGQKDGVWVCSYQEVQSLAVVLREILIKTYAAAASQENKGEKWNCSTPTLRVMSLSKILNVL